ncbi:unnamed protein product [Withania somnifera]
MLPGKSDEIILIVTLVFLCSLSWVMSPQKVKENPKNCKKNLQVFLLAGQSNMGGSGGVRRQIEKGIVKNASWDGFVPKECKPNPMVLRLNAAEKWEKAHEPLNYGIDCIRYCGLGPGMAFANEILKRDPAFGVIGLVPCARGGTGLHRWIRGSGLLWYHGESDLKAKNASSLYKSNLEKFFHDFCSDLQDSILPIFQVIIPYPKKTFVAPYIEVVRAAQLEVNTPNVIKLDGKELELGPDGIHLTTPAQVRLGHMFANAF